MRRMMASPSKILLGSLSSRVRSTRAALRSLLRANCTRQSSRLLRRPYSPTIFSSLSRRSFSNGRRGFLKVLLSVRLGRNGKGEYGFGELLITFSRSLHAFSRARKKTFLFTAHTPIRVGGRWSDDAMFFPLTQLAAVHG